MPPGGPGPTVRSPAGTSSPDRHDAAELLANRWVDPTRADDDTLAAAERAAVTARSGKALPALRLRCRTRSRRTKTPPVAAPALGGRPRRVPSATRRPARQGRDRPHG